MMVVYIRLEMERVDGVEIYFGYRIDRIGG